MPLNIPCIFRSPIIRTATKTCEVALNSNLAKHYNDVEDITGCDITELSNNIIKISASSHSSLSFAKELTKHIDDGLANSIINSDENITILEFERTAVEKFVVEKMHEITQIGSWAKLHNIEVRILYPTKNTKTAEIQLQGPTNLVVGAWFKTSIQSERGKI